MYISISDLKENVIKEMDVLLEVRELIKVKLQEGSLPRAKDAVNEATENTPKTA